VGPRGSLDRCAKSRPFDRRTVKPVESRYTDYATTLLDLNKSPTRCNNFSVYYTDVYLLLNMFRAFFRPSSGAR